MTRAERLESRIAELRQELEIAVRERDIARMKQAAYLACLKTIRDLVTAEGVEALLDSALLTAIRKRLDRAIEGS